MLIDTHCHLHDQQWFSPDLAEKLLTDAQTIGVEQIICIGTSHKDSLVARDFAKSHGGVFWTYGVHPEFAITEGVMEAETELAAMFAPAASPLQHPVAIGEIGLDYHYTPETRTAQIRLFEQMLQLATDYNLPVSLHIREAFPDAFAILKNFPRIRAVVHSFTGSKRDLAYALSQDFYIGVNGLITYTTTPLAPLEKILLETDAPFLTPLSNRGTMNVPGNVCLIADFLAEKMGVAKMLIVEQTTKNARRLFNI